MLHGKIKPSTFTNHSSNMKVNTTNNMLHSKSTYFYRWGSGSRYSYTIPVTCGLALLCGVGLAFNPITNSNNVNKVYAETVTSNPTDYSSISMTLSNNGAELDSEDTVSANVTPGLVNYIDNNIKISTSKIDRFYVTVQAAENGTSVLTGIAHGETIAPVGNNVSPTNFPDNSWGYALVSTTNSNNDSISSNSLTYSSLPAYNTAITPQYSSGNNLQDGEYNLKLTFAAKINADKPSDHYTTKAMVSVAADAGELPLITGVTTMQDFAKYNACNRIDEAGMQLVDDRTASGLGKTTYWVAKLKDGKCWMAQNLDLVLAEGSVLKPADTDVITEYTMSALGNYADPGMYVYKFSDYIPYPGCGNPTDEACIQHFEAYTDNVNGDERTHYLIGNYYPRDIANTGTMSDGVSSICPKGWKLPTRVEYDTLIGSVDSTEFITKAFRLPPYYFVPAGNYTSGYTGVNDFGNYWTSTLYEDSSAYVLSFYAEGLFVDPNGGAPAGCSVRCVAR